jgi:hypothetical protein
MWYSGRDFRAMNSEVKHNLKKELCYGFDPYDSERSWRGLEHIREGVPNAKLNRRRQYIRSFLYVHKTVGVTDPEELGAYAAAQINSDLVRAQQFAAFDAYEASTVYYEDTYAYGYYSDDYSYCDSAHSSFDDYCENECYYKDFCDIPRTKCLPPAKQTIIMASQAA